MKKLVALMLAAVLLMGLVACGGGTTSTNPPETQEPAQSQAPVQTQAPGEEEPAEPGETPEAEPTAEPTPEPTPKPTNASENNGDEMFSKQASIEETVLVDENDVKITALKLEYDYNYANVTVRIENNTDKTLTFHTSSWDGAYCSVNGCMMDVYMNEDVAPGKKSNAQISFSKNDLAMYGITEISCMELAFYVTGEDNNRYMEPTPVLLTTTEIDSYDATRDGFAEMLKKQSFGEIFDSVVAYNVESEYEIGGVRVPAQALVIDQDRLYLILEFENTAGQNVTVGCSDITINGLKVSNGTWDTSSLNSGARRLETISLYSVLDESYWDKLGIESVAEASCLVSIEDESGNELGSKTAVKFTNPGVPVTLNTEREPVYENEQVKIIWGGVSKDDLESLNYRHFLLLVHNKTEEELTLGVDNDTLSVNGYMIDETVFDRRVPAGSWGLMDVEVRGAELEEIGIENDADITEVEMTIQIADKPYHYLAEPVVTITLPLPETNG